MRIIVKLTIKLSRSLLFSLHIHTYTHTHAKNENKKKKSNHDMLMWIPFVTIFNIFRTFWSSFTHICHLNKFHGRQLIQYAKNPNGNKAYFTLYLTHTLKPNHRIIIYSATKLSTIWSVFFVFRVRLHSLFSHFFYLFISAFGAPMCVHVCVCLCVTSECRYD